MPIARRDQTGAVLVAVKVAPGARASAVMGRLGDRLKVRVAAPAEGGKANKAVCDLLAGELGLRRGAVEVVAGKTSPEKTVRFEGVAPERIEKRW